MTTELTPADVVTLIDDLLEGWETRHDRGQAIPFRARRAKTSGQVALTLALAHHAHRLIAKLRPALPDQLTVLDMPTVRAAYEASLKAVWVDHLPEAAEAMLNEEIRQRKVIRDEMSKTVSMAHLAELVKHADDEGFAPSPTARGEAQHVNQMTARLGIDSAYAIYRMLSQLSHPGGMVADFYIEEGEDENNLFAFRPDPGAMGGSDGFTWTLAACLIWAGRAADHTDGNRRRSELMAAARALGIKADVQLLPARRTGRDSRPVSRSRAGDSANY